MSDQTFGAAARRHWDDLERHSAEVEVEPMDKDLDAALYAAALHTITQMWGQEMDTMQRASLANQIVREIERRQIV